MWDQRFAGEAYFYGTEPNRFLTQQAHRIRPGGRVLAVADGEGRNGVWLASQGFDVVAVDSSQTGLDKTRRLAGERNVCLKTLNADLLDWDWPVGGFDAVVAIFIQFAGPDDRPALFENIKQAVKPGGVVLMQGYRPEQVALGTGGPPDPEQLYTEPMLREAFGDFDIEVLEAHDSDIREGAGHAGRSALIDLVARKPGV